MQITDFQKSFILFRTDILKKPSRTTSHKPPSTLNNGRIQVECRIEVTETATGVSHEFVLGASCKTERVGVEGDIWTDPNGDFIPIFGREQFMILKAYDRAEKGIMFYPHERGPQPERQVGISSEVFDSGGYTLVYEEGTLLPTAPEIVEATLAGKALVARIVLESERYTAVIDHPVKTMNASERDDIYQTDTGAILLPDLSREPQDLLSGMELAFEAFNSPDWVEFIVRVPTPVVDGINVHHYSKSVRMNSKNEIYQVG